MYVLFLVSLSVNVSLPDVVFQPLQSPDAEQESALVEDQINVNSVLVVALFEEGEKDTEGAVGI